MCDCDSLIHSFAPVSNVYIKWSLTEIGSALRSMDLDLTLFYCCYRLMAAGRPVISPLTGAEMGSNLKPNLLVRSLVRGRDRR